MLRKNIPVLILTVLLLGHFSVPGWGSPEELQEALTLNEKVVQLTRAGNYKEALPLAQKALQIRYKDLGPEHPDVAISLTALGQLYQEMGKLNEALPLLERALQIRYKALGQSNPATAASLNNLGDLYLLQKDFDKSLPLLERSLQCREKVQGPKHPDTAASLNSLATLYRHRREYEKALPLYERALKIREKALSSNSPETAVSMSNLGELYQIMDSSDKALILHEKALQINESVLGEFHPNTAASLNDLAAVYDKMGFYAKAQPLAEKSLQIRQKVLGLQHLNTSQSLDTLATVYYHLKEYDKALPLYERALEIREKSAGLEHPDTAETLNHMGSLYKDTGAPDKALDFYQRALQIREKTFAPEDAAMLASLYDLGAFYVDTGDPAKAIPLYERLLRGKEKKYGPDHLEITACLTKYAQAYQSLGELDKALPLYSRILSIKEKALGAEHPDTVAGITALAGLYSGMGAYEKSIPLYEKVVKIKEKVSGPDKPDTAVSLNQLALAFQGQGEYDKALALYNRSVKIMESAPGAEPAVNAEIIAGLASLHKARGDFDKARPLYEKALKIMEGSANPDNPATAGALKNLGNVYVAMGLYDKALPLYKRAEKISEQAKGPSARETGDCKQRLADLYYLMGDIDHALPAFEQTAKISVKNLGADHPATSKIFANLGMLCLAKNDQEKAAEYFKQVKSKDARVDLALSRGRAEDAWEILDAMAPPLASTPAFQVRMYTRKGQALAGIGRLPEAAVSLWQAVQGSEKKPLKSMQNQLPSFRVEEYLEPYRLLTEVLCKLASSGQKLPPELQEFGPSPRAAALSMAEAAKVREILAGLALAPRNSRRSELPPDLRSREEDVQFRLAAQEVQWDKAVSGGQTGLLEVINSRKKLNTSYENLVQELRLTQPLYAALYYPRPESVKNLPLADDEVVIEYTLGKDAGAIFVVRRDGVHYMYPLPLGRQALETKVRDFLEPLMQGKPGEFSRQKAVELFDLLLAKPFASIASKEHIIIVPDGILGLLPFEALVPPTEENKGDDLYVGDQRVLYYYPSITVLAQQRGRPESPAARPLFALGNPQYAQEAEIPAEKKTSTLTRLKEDEAAADSKPKRKKAPEAADKIPAPTGFLALAADLSRGPISRGSANPGILYPPLPGSEAEVRAIANIFEVADASPDLLLGRQANKRQLKQANLTDYRYLHFATHTELTDKIQGRLEPFILLAPGKSDVPDDNFLMPSDILDLEVGARMVFLDHCRTGKDQAMAGQGLINLSRAFLYAGARSVMFNLWEKKPEAGREFLIKFYGYLNAGKGRSEALRLARLDVRKTWPDPVCWAGYVLYGEGE